MLISIISRSSQGSNYNNSLTVRRTAMENPTLSEITQDGNHIDTLDTKNATEKRKFDKLWPQYMLLVENAIKNKSITKKQFTKYIERLRYVGKVYPNKAIYWLLEMQNAILKQKRLFPRKEREILVLYLGLVQTQDSGNIERSSGSVSIILCMFYFSNILFWNVGKTFYTEMLWYEMLFT